jgi:DNA-binding response OmpR family regulator
MTDSSLQTTRALVVVDDVDTLVALGKVLSSLGFDGLPTLDCATARTMAKRSGKLAFALACERLPDGSGIDLLVELKRAYGCGTAVLSAEPEPPGGCPVGVDLWLRNPFDLTAIRQAMRALGRMTAHEKGRRD